MSNGVFQNVIVQLKEISGYVFGVMDQDSCVISCTDVSLLGERWPEAMMKVNAYPEGTVTHDQKTFKAVITVWLSTLCSAPVTMPLPGTTARWPTSP